uniref:Uncharacterized protein n=1 Tax=Arundo donax TaxID=35708 RepID=A0A0A9BJG9_ARUDO
MQPKVEQARQPCKHLQVFPVT